MAPPQTEVADI